jgi:hypothetical protein
VTDFFLELADFFLELVDFFAAGFLVVEAPASNVVPNNKAIRARRITEVVRPG